ncbi:MAG: hypothetical protein J0J10_03465 [Bosea sp.]|jgi:hypothetical protein|uniref:hypothetical protein n=1 Tax=Bosea sp. (in: a-proteobacteria) TaxID=1871050 RepID=UPI001AD55B2C|nr:hypothetical protein [Bosea sp. (in: a-proteobacteria)]MBN9467812.1 hypothetical protein [Bosea sp. (in: a-proteobacteria)]
MKLALSTIAVGLLLGSAGVSAQSVNIGPGGISVDPRTQRERAIDREIRREERWRERERYERRRDWRAERGRDCRTITETRETPRGEVRRTTRVCD